MRDTSHFGYELNMGPLPFDSALSRITTALEHEGLSILSRADLGRLFREKLNVEFPRYVILEVLNAAAAHRGMAIDPKLGLLLPCHIVVRDTGEGIMVCVVNARALSGLMDESRLDPVLRETHSRLCRMLAELRCVAA
jgi:uncharacterized protein (DUF302 family)